MSWSFLDDHVPKYKSHDAESALLSNADPQKRDEYKKINRLCHFWEKISYFQKFHHGSNSRDFKKILEFPLDQFKRELLPYFFTIWKYFLPKMTINLFQRVNFENEPKITRFREQKT